jgi:hypothetical protein
MFAIEQTRRGDGWLNSSVEGGAKKWTKFFFDIKMDEVML